jgi:AbiV family abortive infection protein
MLWHLVLEKAGTPMGSPQRPNFTTSLLHSYSNAALQNADELLVEALLLRDNDHMARAYFLAVCCIEETGKALLAFDSQHRNLTDPAVCKKLQASMENHRRKIEYVLAKMAFYSAIPREALKVALDLMLQLKHGREPSMYTDLRTSPDRVQMPREMLRDAVAQDCIRLAENCLVYAHRYVRETEPANFTIAHDRLFTMRAAKFREIISSEDFWWYYISSLESGQQDIAYVVLGYERDHFKTGRLFRAAQ